MIYVNEIDPYCAQWLQNLMDAGVLPPGHIDTRSIEDVTPNDLAGYTQCHFFAGLGGWIYALDLAGWPRSRPCWTGSCPCQPFSAAGKGAGFADERHLWPAWQHLIAQRKPATVFGEQVASKAADDWIDLVHADMEGLGYAFGCVPFPSAGIGAPHIRDRNYWVANANNSGRIGWWPSQAGDGRDSTRQQSERFCDAGGMADADHEGLEGRRISAERTVERPAWPGCLVGGMAYADGGDASAEREQRSGQQRQQQAHGGAGRMADAMRPGSLPGALAGVHRCEESAGTRDGQSERSGSVGRMADTEVVRRKGKHLHTGGRLPPLGAADSRSDHWASPLHGFWRAADWLACTDGKWRPVEPGTFPLAHGIPGRVGRLRAYGNAINPWQAAEFVVAFMEQQVRRSLAAA